MSGTGDNKGDNNEAARSSSSDMPLLINNGSINSSPKAKRRKGKKKRRRTTPDRCIASSAQWVTCEICIHLSLTGTRLTFVYGFNRYKERIDLWNYIQEAREENKHIPWAIIGDFNAVLRPGDRSGGARD
ncbi:hypothetical protein SADUNF_Sadunf10G0072400 [Salix dunnii]|uniref:Endonuclease/exonuclease/phosphatase domain-containing protein n=1 Tax=Salix dunnii TaxID=1413687 RepID=A0A835JSV1_9ROSI|nr:hypothetical protein SADUNF_Sadunf10G0072400 [Salix dunnii]